MSLRYFVFAALVVLPSGCDILLYDVGDEGKPCLDNGKCNNDNLICYQGNCCKPSCAGKVCGDDGCGTSCGTCSGATDYCTEEGFCIDDCGIRECGLSPTKGFSCGACENEKPDCSIDGICFDDLCKPDPCNSHGTCTVDNEIVNCSCETIYDGDECEKCADNTVGKYPLCFLPDLDYCLESQCFALTDTGQEICYNNSVEIECPNPAGSDPCATKSFCGQDAQYSSSKMLYTCYDSAGLEQDPCDASADVGEFVIDEVTGLMWQRTFVKGKTYDESVTYCDELIYAEYDDWRLPNIYELQSIVDYSKWQPSMNEIVFPGMAGIPLKSITETYEDKNFAWAIGYAGGNISNVEKGVTQSARCVRTDSQIGFEKSGIRTHQIESVQGEEIIYDTINDLVWAGTYGENLTWEESLSFCESLVYGGRGTWKVPDAKELVSIVNYGSYNPASYIADVPPGNYWTSTTTFNNPLRAWYISLINGLAFTIGKAATANVICVGRSF